MSHVISCSKLRKPRCVFQLPTSNFQLFFNGNLRQLFLFKKKKETFKNLFSWAVCDRDGRYLTISVKRTTSNKIKKLNITPSFINMNLFELENSHFMPLIADVGSNLHDHKNTLAPLSSYSLDFRTVQWTGGYRLRMAGKIAAVRLHMTWHVSRVVCWIQFTTELFVFNGETKDSA